MRSVVKAVKGLTTEVTGKSLFKEKRHEDVRRRAAEINCTSNGGAYNQALAEMWNDSATDQAHWEKLAKEHVDIEK